ncbi:ring-hydroxylating dioxygenase ferredoxin subunit [Acetobacter nitrogenifigens DSM 23921 = NBRC 105050]|uniref:Rieske 2Fe-2S domain-containing protein n=1 Tax=Acetobacter nitrogenifigens TaxID=285268 RepID=UPI00041EAC65|nr:Rieske 2Fe-2S domain-containing protein [Acetobacter nitrogenifigens]GBQ99076.1 ring-hydroxylating dioxygenase ferredoxin subunit [Acetobacter nitrogenifigens DSM 23921 = NBRC 105050]
MDQFLPTESHSESVEVCLDPANAATDSKTSTDASDAENRSVSPNSASGQDLRRIHCDPDFWYPVAWSRELRRGKVIATRYAGHPIALVRPDEGPVFALEDRCAHRQVPLSKGRVCGQSVQCCYHGWAYGRSGRCIDVPYLGKGKLPNGVRTYPVREQDGLIFVFPGDPEKAAATPLRRELAQSNNAAYKTRRFGRHVACHYSFMHENLMDMNHQFMHMKQMGQMRPRFLGQKREPGLVEARYSFARTSGKQPLGEALIFGERRDASAKYADRDVMTIRTEYPFQTLRIQTGDEAPVMDLWIAYTPQDADQLTNRTFGLLSVKKPGVPGLLDLAWPFLVAFTERIFAEDREIVELEQKAWNELGGDHNQEVFPVINALRSLLAECGVQPGASTPGSSPQEASPPSSSSQGREDAAAAPVSRSDAPAPENVTATRAKPESRSSKRAPSAKRKAGAAKPDDKPT